MSHESPPAASGELTAIRWEIADRVATVWLHRPHRHNAWTGTMHAEYRQVMADLEHRDDVRALVVTGTPPAFCVGGDSTALSGHGRARWLRQRSARRAGPARWRRPPRRRHGVAARLPPPDHRRRQRGVRRCRTLARVVLRPEIRLGHRQDHHRGAETRSAGGVRRELDAAPPRRRHSRQRPAALGPCGHRRGDRRLGSVERRRSRRCRDPRCGAATTPDSSPTRSARTPSP